MPKQKIETFQYSKFPSSSTLDIPSDNYPTFEPPMEIKTKEGNIIFFQAQNGRKSYGVIPGWAVSKPRKAPGREMMLVKIRRLTVTEQKKYRAMLREKLRGTLNFW